jgi:cytochrome c oxidase subunit 3
MANIDHAQTEGLAHQFDDVHQQRQAVTLGMWAFLVTEVMMFGGLFAGYMVYKFKYTAAFMEASNLLNFKLGAINTAVLICSSLTMVLAVHAAQVGKRKAIAGYLLATILLGCVFFTIKYFEYAEKWEHHLVPGTHFNWTGETAPLHAHVFFSFYFVMTGLHAVHMIIGVAILAVIAIKALRGRYSPRYYSPVDISGLYWHFVDIVWIFLFPLLYLIGRTPN